MNTTPSPDFFYNQLDGCTLEVIDNTPHTQVFLLRKYPGRTMMSSVLIFTPYGITLTGDLRVEGNGVCAPGYGLDWFTQPHPDRRYLAAKFLRTGWVPECAHAYYKAIRDEWAEQQTSIESEFAEEIAERKAQAERDGETYSPPPEMLVAIYEAEEIELQPRTWRIGEDELKDATIVEALDHFLANDENFANPNALYEALPIFNREPSEYTVAGVTIRQDKWRCPFDTSSIGGYDYNPIAVGWLWAIQRRFAELYAAIAPQLAQERDVNTRLMEFYRNAVDKRDEAWAETDLIRNKLIEAERKMAVRHTNKKKARNNQ